MMSSYCSRSPNRPKLTHRPRTLHGLRFFPHRLKQYRHRFHKRSGLRPPCLSQLPASAEQECCILGGDSYFSELLGTAESRGRKEKREAEGAPWLPHGARPLACDSGLGTAEGGSEAPASRSAHGRLAGPSQPCAHFQMEAAPRPRNGKEKATALFT